VALTDYFTGTTLSVNSITCTTGGIKIGQVVPSLPVTVTGGSNGNEVDITPYLEPIPKMTR
jgi:hypothetical protein